MNLARSGALAALLSASLAHAQVNAPVAPDAIYLARTGASPGLSVIDLNGFGQGTGDPTFDPVFGPGSETHTKAPWNPNVQFQGPLLTPPIGPPSSSLDGGSAGVFTLTKSAALTDRLTDPGVLGRAGDLMLGQPLDLVFNNGPGFGCAAGGGSLCASTGLQLFTAALGGPSTLAPLLPGQFTTSILGGGNPISWAPHPNPPPLLAVPLCESPFIPGQEPTSIDSFAVGLQNLLVPGDPFGDPAAGIPPSGLLTPEQNSFFQGPSSPQVSPVACSSFQVRQQIGHFLYAIDAETDELVVLNSNRFTVLDRIALADPTSLAMSPELDFLAVTSRATGTVSFVDIQPSSATFHQVVKETVVGAGPSGVAWQPGNEDIVVCNEGDGTISILSAFDLSVRKTLKTGLAAPFEVALTARQSSFGSFSNVYYGYVLGRDGRIALFESGPGGPNGWGYDAIVLHSPFALENPRAMQPDPLTLTSGVWIAHDGAVDADGEATGVGGGALTNVRLAFETLGQLPLTPGTRPNARGKSLDVVRSIGGDVLTGLPQDVAFDNLRNLGSLGNAHTVFSAGVPKAMNGKGTVRAFPTGVTVVTNNASYLFAPVRTREGGAVDVIDLATGARVDTNPFQPGVQSIPASDAAVAMDYFRQ